MMYLGFLNQCSFGSYFYEENVSFELGDCVTQQYIYIYIYFFNFDFDLAIYDNMNIHKGVLRSNIRTSLC